MKTLPLFILLISIAGIPAIRAEQPAPAYKELLELAKNEASPEKAVSYLKSAVKLAKNDSEKMWAYFKLGHAYGTKLQDYYNGYMEMRAAYDLGYTNKAVVSYLKLYSDNPGVRLMESKGLLAPIPPKIPAKDFSFIVIADTHALTNQADSNYVRLREKLIGSDRFMLVNGDLAASWSVTGNYVSAKNFYDTVGLPYYTAIGNHDSPFGGSFEYMKYFGKSCYSFMAGEILFICIDTACGFIGDLQMEWLESTLKGKGGAPCVVFSHFPLVDQPKYIFTNQTDFPKAVKLFEKYKVDWVLAGHTHMYHYTQINGINYLTLPVFYSKYGKYVRMTYIGGKLEYELLPLY